MLHDRLVRLSWKIDPCGYEAMTGLELLLQRDPEFASKSAPSELVCNIACELERDGLDMLTQYELVVPRSGKFKEYTVVLQERSILRDLINSAQRPGADGVLEFVNKWGYLTERMYTPVEGFIRQRSSVAQAVTSKGTDLIPLLKAIGEWDAAQIGLPHRELGLVNARAITERGRPRLALMMPSLLHFCALEVLQARFGRFDFTTCGNCNRLLPLHARGRPKSYCDDACKMSAFRRRRRDKPGRARRMPAEQGRRLGPKTIVAT